MTDTSRASWSLAVCAALALPACTVDTGDIAFLPDEEFRSFVGGSGGSPQPGGGAGGTSQASGGSAGAPMGMNSCSPEQEGTARCTQSGELEICKGQSYTLRAKCESKSLCSAVRKTCLGCEPGTFRCSKDTLEQCNLEGSAYDLVQVCAEGDCQADGHDGFCKVCEPGEAVCERAARSLAGSKNDGAPGVSVHDSLRVCNPWGSGTEVSEICSADKPVCDAEAKQCLTCEKGAIVCNGSQLAHCSTDGEKLEPLADGDCGHPDLCDAQRARCLTGECSHLLVSSDPDARIACRGAESNELSFCTSAGKWEQLALCANGAACEAGIAGRLCRDQMEACVPGMSRCAEGEVLERCAELAAPDSFAPSGGSWYAYATCAGECLENGSGIAECASAREVRPYTDARVCTPGEASYLDCSEEECVSVACPADEICAGSREGCMTCIPGTYRCDGNVLVQCDESGSGEDVIRDCGDGVCDRFRPACLPALPGESFCDEEGKFRVVAADGTAQVVETCGSPALCDRETGCKEPVCVVGSRVCDPANGRDVLGCPDGTELKAAVPTRCASADRCEDGLGCVIAFRVAAGESHTCALLLQENGGDFNAAGVVKCWGANESGQLGNGSTLLGDEAEARPVVLRKTPSDVNRVDPRFMTTGLCAGKSFTCADVVLDDGAGVMCWGNNEQGQLGLGVLPSQSSPRAFNAATSLVTKKSDLGQRDTSLVPFLGLEHVTCGADFACALDREGAAWCWGANDVGQLGIGEVTSTPWPSAQPVDRGRNDTPPVFVAISAGERHVCGLDEEGTLWCWGGGARGQLGSAPAMASPAPRSLGLPATTYALGRDFTILRGPDESEPLAFGQNFFGQLATGTSVASTTPVVASAAGKRVSLLFGGPTAAHACALRAGSLVCWGANSRGQLGDNSNEDRYTPVVALEAGTVDVFGEGGSVALGRSHTCAVDASGGLWCWGGNERKQLGASVKEPTSTKPVQALAALNKMR